MGKGKTKIEKVMGEYKRGTLESSSGSKVKSRRQAVAIAMSEAGKSKPKKKRDPRPAARGRKKDASNTVYREGKNNEPRGTYWRGV